MKHTVPVTATLILAFLFIQVFGLFALSLNTVVEVAPGGTITVTHEDTVIGERPPIEGWVSLAYMLLGILIGTSLVLLFMRLGEFRLWKGLYFFAVWLASSITLGVFISAYVALAVGIALAILETSRKNVLIHNAVELLIYPGIAIIFVPLFSIFWAILLLLAISAYDMFAVWKSKHMISLATFQAESQAFAGFVIPYGRKGRPSVKAALPKKLTGKGEYRTAILGGGDIAFPLVFAGVVMDWLIKTMGLAKGAALLESSVISLFAALALLLLFMKAGKDRFYPAMPFITAGCFAGFAVVWTVNFLV